MSRNTSCKHETIPRNSHNRRQYTDLHGAAGTYRTDDAHGYRPHVQQLRAIGPRHTGHVFISAQTLLEHSAFFIERKEKTIVLTNGAAGTPQTSHFHTLNIYQSEDSMVRALLQLQQHSHAHGRHLPQNMNHPYMANTSPSDPNGLSTREIEVLTLIVRGLTNKEIADRLCISTTTVISHRKNIMEKLNVRSVSGLTIYAVMNGYIEADRI